MYYIRDHAHHALQCARGCRYGHPALDRVSYRVMESRVQRYGKLGLNQNVLYPRSCTPRITVRARLPLRPPGTWPCIIPCHGPTCPLLCQIGPESKCTISEILHIAHYSARAAAVTASRHLAVYHTVSWIYVSSDVRNEACMPKTSIT